MGFSVYDLLKVILLVVNAAAVLHPQRFLRKYSLDRIDEGSGMRQHLSGLFHAARFMRVPLIGLNVLIILVELIFG